jgi:Tfp pilus assembly protein FimV
MAFDLSTPTAQLAFGVAQRAQEVQDMKARLEEEARARVQARLAPYGNDLSQFDSTFKSIYDPAAATQQARAKAMQEYVTGLPELLARVQAEKSAGSGGGGGTTSATPYQPFDASAILGYLVAGARPKPVAVQKDLGNGMTYGNVGGYGAVYPTGSAGPAVKPKYTPRTQNADRFG